MEKIKNGDSIIYQNQEGVVYGRPREVKSLGLVYTIRIGNDYVKLSSWEISQAVKIQ